jgi:hypothetical protein
MDQELIGTANVTFAHKLEQLVKNIPASEVTLIELYEKIGKDSLMFFTIFLSLVFLVPVSVPGVSTAFGSAILLIGIAQLLNRRLWLPEKIATRAIASEKLTGVLNRALVWFRRFERISRPYRLQSLASEGKIGLFNKVSYILAAILLMAPFGFIPFSNTLPAAALIFFALGVIQKDGRCIIFGHLSNLATILYFSALIMGGGITIFEVLQRI